MKEQEKESDNQINYITKAVNCLVHNVFQIIKKK